MFSRIVLGLFFIIGGGAVVYFSFPLTENLGRIVRAEKHLGSTRNLYILAGFSLMIIGGLVMLNIINLSSPTEMVPEMATQ